MNYQKIAYLTVFIGALAVAWPAGAGLPQYGATAANTNDTDPITESWNCSTAVGSVMPPSRCYSGDLLPSGYRVQGNGTPYGDSQLVSHVAAAIGWPAPASNDPVNGAYILWLGFAGFGNGGPGTGYTVDSTGPGDNFVIWRTPNTHDGRRAQSGTTTLMNDMVRPAGIHKATAGGGMQFVPEEPGKKAFWVPGGFQYDPDYGTWRIISEATYPTGNPSTFTDTTLYIGNSSNGFDSYTWRPIVNFRFKPTDPGGPHHYGVRWTPQGRSFVKDPFNSDRWIGITGWGINESGTITGRGTAPAMIDFSQEGNPAIGIQYCVGFQDGLDMSDPRARQGFTGDYDFYCYREGENDLPVKTRPQLTTGGEASPASMIGNFGSLALVSNGGGFHGEIWTSGLDESPLWCAVPANRALYGYSSESECALSRHWCGSFLDSTQYEANRTGDWANTNRLVYREWSPTTLWLVNPKTEKKELNNELYGLFDSTVGWPSPQGDHVNTYWAASRFDWPQETALGRNLLYVSRKRSICFEPLGLGNAKYGGLGSSVLILEEQ